MVDRDSSFKPDLVADDSRQHDEDGTNTEPRAEVGVRLPPERPLLEQTPPDEHDRSSQRLQTQAKTSQIREQSTRFYQADDDEVGAIWVAHESGDGERCEERFDEVCPTEKSDHDRTTFSRTHHTQDVELHSGEGLAQSRMP